MGPIGTDRDYRGAENASKCEVLVLIGTDWDQMMVERVGFEPT